MMLKSKGYLQDGEEEKESQPSGYILVDQMETQGVTATKVTGQSYRTMNSMENLLN